MNDTFDGYVPPPWDEPQPVQPRKPDEPVSPRGVEVTGFEPDSRCLDEVRMWLGRFITVLHERDLDLLTLWAAHTHLVMETYTTPRLVIDSPVHGSGKTTVLEHLERLAVRPVQMASLSSPALLTRMLKAGMRTILIDEADRSLDPKKEGIAELIAVLNSGYKRGGTRPVLVPGQGGEWTVDEMPTFAPCAMAGNNPALPDDTRSRCVRILLMPDLDGSAETSDWELIEADAVGVGSRLAQWCESVRDFVRVNRPELPEQVKARNAEKWRPLKRVAVAAGGRWPDVVDELAAHDVEQQAQDKEDGMTTMHPHVALLAHLYEVWPSGLSFVPTADLVRALAMEHPEMWGDNSSYGKALTAQRFGRMLARSYGVNSTRQSNTGPRGYTKASLERPWYRLGITPKPVTT